MHLLLYSIQEAATQDIFSLPYPDGAVSIHPYGMNPPHHQATYTHAPVVYLHSQYNRVARLAWTFRYTTFFSN